MNQIKTIELIAFVVKVVDTIDFYAIVLADNESQAIKKAEVMWPQASFSIEEEYNTVL